MNETALVQAQGSAHQPAQAWTREQIELVKRTVAKGTTDDELRMFLYIAQKYDLDPFVKEIWCIKRAKKLPDGSYDHASAPAIIMTSRDGYLKVAQRHPDYEGLNSGVVREGDEFEFVASEGTVKHKFGAKRGEILGAWAIAYRKGRKPVACFVDFSEYFDQASTTWQKYPSAMIQKVAEAFVLKRQFGISGLVTREELAIDVGAEDSKVAIEAEYEAEPEPEEPVEEQPPMREPGEDDEEREMAEEQQKAQPAPQANEKRATEKQVKAIFAIMRSIGATEEWLKAQISQKWGVESVKELTFEQASKVIDGLKILEARKKKSA